MAIIDILTPYDTKKKAAHAAKTVKHGVSSPCPCAGIGRSRSVATAHPHPPPRAGGTTCDHG